MEIEEILRIEDDLQRNDALYSVFNEDERLVSQAGQVEFLTTFHKQQTVRKLSAKPSDFWHQVASCSSLLSIMT
ncbi:TPA: hypothetical protein ACGO6M_001327 [Streptococcus suis]